MLLIYVQKLTNRLGYTLNVVFRDILHIDFSMTTDRKTFEQSDNPKLSYGEEPVGDELWLQSSNLLFETVLHGQDLRYFENDGMPAIFPVFNKRSIMNFDVFAATFYLVSRYEEYLPHHEDIHGRYMAQESLAYKRGFLDKPIVDHWVLKLSEKLHEKYPAECFVHRSFEFVETIDIDAAYCYLHKGAFRTISGWLRDGISRRDFPEMHRRWRVLRHKEQDPFDNFEYIIKLKSHFKQIKLIFFVLLGDYSMYDKPADYHNEHFRELLKHLADYAKLGIHPSYKSMDEPEKINKEVQRLSDIIHRDIKRNRFHFLRFRIPNSYRDLSRYNIHEDFSMGYADEIGFRAGTCSSFPYYDIPGDQETQLIIHPFCVMDTTLQRYKNMSPEEALEVYKQLINEIKSVDGTFCGIWHNQNLSELFGWQGWRDTYEKVLEYSTK